jgi:hypothetical protein
MVEPHSADTVGRENSMTEIVLTEIEQAAIDMVEKCSSPGKDCARNAFRHICKAWRLQETDLEMAAFRAITAEEEAATAIFHALKKRKYKGSEKLKRHNHIHKNALVPFCIAVAGALALTEELFKSKLYFDKEEIPPRFRVRIDVSSIVPDCKYAFPEPPLHFNMHMNDKPYDFSDKINDIVLKNKSSDITKYLEERANKRNRLLYAAAEGVPEVTSLGNFLPIQRTNVLMLVILYLMIDPYPKKQLFVQQSLQAFLKTLKLLTGDIEFE